MSITNIQSNSYKSQIYVRTHVLVNFQSSKNTVKNVKARNISKSNGSIDIIIHWDISLAIAKCVMWIIECINNCTIKRSIYKYTCWERWNTYDFLIWNFYKKFSNICSNTQAYSLIYHQYCICNYGTFYLFLKKLTYTLWNWNNLLYFE